MSTANHTTVAPQECPTRARSAYSLRVAAIDVLIEKLDALMIEHRNLADRYPEDWGYAGDLAHVEELIGQVVEFMGGDA